MLAMYQQYHCPQAVFINPHSLIHLWIWKSPIHGFNHSFGETFYYELYAIIMQQGQQSRRGALATPLGPNRATAAPQVSVFVRLY
jgi:hypothetical protein